MTLQDVEKYVKILKDDLEYTYVDGSTYEMDNIETRAQIIGALCNLEFIRLQLITEANIAFHQKTTLI